MNTMPATERKDLSVAEPFVVLRYFGSDVNPEAPEMGAYRKNRF